MEPPRSVDEIEEQLAEVIREREEVVEQLAVAMQEQEEQLAGYKQVWRWDSFIDRSVGGKKSWKHLSDSSLVPTLL